MSPLAGILMGSAILSFFVQIIGRRLLLSLLATPVVVSVFVLYPGMTQPARGGGAAMWPIAIVFVAGSAALGASIGTLCAKLLSPVKTESAAEPEQK